jgi:hypothetical protein
MTLDGKVQIAQANILAEGRQVVLYDCHQEEIGVFTEADKHRGIAECESDSGWAIHL